MKWLWLLLAIGASAVMFELALPPAGWSVLGWVCFVPTLLTCRGKGFAVGFGAAILSLILAAQLAKLGLGVPPSILEGDPGWIYAGFVLFGLPVGLLHGLIGEQRREEGSRLVVLVAWAVLFEALLLIYLPAHIALTQSRSMVLVSLASVTGIWGVSALVWGVNLAVTRCLGAKEYKRAGLVVAIAALASAPFPPVGSDRGGLEVIAVQSPLDDTDFLEDFVATAPSGSVVVWPEAAGVGFVIQGDTRILSELATKSNVLLATSYDEPSTPLPFNAMEVFGSGERTIYRKRQLFGGERSTHRRGQEAIVARIAGHTFGMNICFDSCFPSVTRETAKLGAELILLPTLDPISPNGVCQAIHAAYTPFRASELGVGIVRADATAYSQIVDEWGRVRAEAKSGWQGSIGASLTLRRRHTLYGRLADWFLVGCFVVVAMPLWQRVRKRRLSKGRPDQAEP